jgi:hypothetical protein
MGNGGIRDHKEKLLVISIFLDAKEGVRSCVRELNRRFRIGQDVSSFADNIRKYSLGVNPNGTTGTLYINAVLKLLAEVGIKEPNLRSIYINSSFDKFCSIIPHNIIYKWPKLEKLLQLSRNKSASNLLTKTFMIPSNSPVDIEEMFENRNIDQLIIYESEKAALSWSMVLNNRAYKQYEECEQALKKLLQSTQWTDFINHSLPDGFVKFGAGSTSKDKIIVEHYHPLMEKGHKINFCLVDYSAAMLAISNEEFSSAISNGELRHSDKINFYNIKTNFLTLTNFRHRNKRHNHIRRKKVPIAFFITGGTIGNLNEAEFLQSVKKVAEPGDMLIICCEMVPETINDKYREKLLKKYNHVDAKNMLSPVLKLIWYLLDKGTYDDDAIYKLIQPKIMEGRIPCVTCVSGSVSVVFEVVCEEGDVRLITSTRYNQEKFIAFAEEHGFKLRHSESSNTNELFKSFMFEVL